MDLQIVHLFLEAEHMMGRGDVVEQGTSSASNTFADVTVETKVRTCPDAAWRWWFRMCLTLGCASDTDVLICCLC